MLFLKAFSEAFIGTGKQPVQYFSIYLTLCTFHFRQATLKYKCSHILLSIICMHNIT